VNVRGREGEREGEEKQKTKLDVPRLALSLVTRSLFTGSLETLLFVLSDCLHLLVPLGLTLVLVRLALVGTGAFA